MLHYDVIIRQYFKITRLAHLSLTYSNTPLNKGIYNRDIVYRSAIRT
jgi:hypothetical protein